MRKFEILELFSLLDKEIYCLIKKSEIFPDYTFGSDFDLFCLDAYSVAEVVTSFFNSAIDEDATVKIEVSSYKIVVDVVENDRIHLRFDLYKSLPYYEEVKIRPSFFEAVIENRQVCAYETVSIFIPSDLDEATIRYFEFHEWFNRRPDKIKHIKIIEDYLNDREIDKLLFLKRVHYYIKFRSFDQRHVGKSRRFGALRNLGDRIERVLQVMKKNGIRYSLNLTFKKIFRRHKFE